MDSIVEVELIMPGLSRGALDEGRIVVFSLTENTPSHVDNFFDRLCDTQLHWSRHTPFLGLIDLSRNADLRLTTQFQSRALDVASMNPDLLGRSAFVMPPLASYLVRPVWFFIRSELPKLMYRHEFASFTDSDAAVRWLREMP